MLYYTDENMDAMSDMLIKDKATQIMMTKEAFFEPRMAHSCIKEEIEEIGEALTDLQEEERHIWKLLRADASEEELLERLEILQYLAKEVMCEALDTAAVTRKAYLQLQRKRAILNTQSDANGGHDA
jgi:predicted transcriptional regulator